MRTLISTFVIGACLVAAPALADQARLTDGQPQSSYAGHAVSGRSSERAYGRAQGDNWRAPRDAEHDSAKVDNRGCIGTNPVYLCPGL